MKMLQARSPCEPAGDRHASIRSAVVRSSALRAAQTQHETMSAATARRIDAAMGILPPAVAHAVQRAPSQALRQPGAYFRPLPRPHSALDELDASLLDRGLRGVNVGLTR